MPAIVDHLLGSRAAGKTDFVIVAFCFSDELALKACLEGCQETRSIPVIMATMNQVNSDGGYAGLTADQFVQRVNRLAGETGYDGPIIFGRDHGGPFIVEAHKKWSRPEAMAWVKKNIIQDLEAGFTCWHADGTSGRDEELEAAQLPVRMIAETTLELIEYCEAARNRRKIGPVSYEVGSEEQQGGLTTPEGMDQYLRALTSGLLARGLGQARIDFAVAQTGTHMKLHYDRAAQDFELVQNGFQPRLVAALDEIAEKYRSDYQKFLFTQHYSDHMTPADAKALRRFGAGKVNFGPEMTMPELKRLLAWENEETAMLKKRGRLHLASNFRETMLEHLDQRPDFWQKFIPMEMTVQETGHVPSIFKFAPNVQDALIVFRGRYVKSRTACRAAAEKLLDNLVSLGIDENPRQVIISEIKTNTVLPRLEQFQMTDLLDKI
ncbi:MAG: class II D-tagatose-bisphosphate aldolase non-catalytic subunit [Desulfobacterales bacterium]